MVRPSPCPARLADTELRFPIVLWTAGQREAGAITSSLQAGPRVLRTRRSAPRRSHAGQAGEGVGLIGGRRRPGEGAPRGAMAGSEAS